MTAGPTRSDQEPTPSRGQKALLTAAALLLAAWILALLILALRF